MTAMAAASTEPPPVGQHGRAGPRASWDPRVIRLARTRLAERGGGVVTTLVSAGHLAALATEADVRGASAQEMRMRSPTGGDAFRDDPDRWLESAPGGPALDALYRAESVPALLAALTGLSWTTTGELGAYSYYRKVGHHLGIHRDIDSCEIAVITCIRDDDTAGDGGGRLCLYPTRAAEPLAAIRSSPEVGAIPIRLQAGQSIVLLGGIVPHRLTPVGRGHTRIVAPLCYRVAD
jgi:hypothetical protein